MQAGMAESNTEHMQVKLLHTELHSFSHIHTKLTNLNLLV